MLSVFKKLFYRFIPSAHISAYIRLLYLGRFLSHVNFRDCLDAGCGTGLFSFYVAKKFPQAHIHGYDISRYDIQRCNEEKILKSMANASFRQLDLMNLSEKGSFDFIFSIDVLEHISQNIEVLKYFYNGLEPGGMFYLAMPYEPGHRYLLPRKYFKEYIAWTKKEHIGEQYDLDAMVATLCQIGFDIVDARYTFGFWGKLAWELDMLTEKKLTIKHILQPLLFIWGFLDVLWKNGPGSYAIRVIAKKQTK